MWHISVGRSSRVLPRWRAPCWTRRTRSPGAATSSRRRRWWVRWRARRFRSRRRACSAPKLGLRPRRCSRSRHLQRRARRSHSRTSSSSSSSARPLRRPQCTSLWVGASMRRLIRLRNSSKSAHTRCTTRRPLPLRARARHRQVQQRRLGVRLRRGLHRRRAGSGLERCYPTELRHSWCLGRRRHQSSVEQLVRRALRARHWPSTTAARRAALPPLLWPIAIETRKSSLRTRTCTVDRKLLLFLILELNVLYTKSQNNITLSS